VAKGSPPIALELVRWSQRRIRPQGYRQAVHCLAQGRLAADARRYGKKVLVACGAEDVITPEAGCKAIARAFPRGEYRTLAGVGHAPHVEAPALVNGMIAALVPR
jgi:pimeloyl-ACP methyl ester carboxylesterase